jgi:hypothetical protein
MALHELDRKMLVVPWTVFAGHLSAVGSESTKDQIAVFFVPQSGIIRGWSAAYCDEAGTTPTLDITLERSTTVLATMTQLTTNETGFRLGDLSIRVNAFEELNIKAAAANTDNTFDGLLIVLEYQILLDL